MIILGFQLSWASGCFCEVISTDVLSPLQPLGVSPITNSENFEVPVSCPFQVFLLPCDLRSHIVTTPPYLQHQLGLQ